MMNDNPFLQERNNFAVKGMIAALHLILAIRNKTISTNEEAEKIINSYVGDDKAAFNFACLIFHDFILQAKKDWEECVSKTG